MVLDCAAAGAGQSGATSAGFVASLCPDETCCFDLNVKPEFADQVGEIIRVRFAGARQIYDPENYELTLAQQDIAAGSHLRLLLGPAPDGRPGGYEAQFIWIGD